MVAAATETQPPDWAGKVDELLTTQGKTRSWLAGEVGISKSHLTLLMGGKRNAHPAQLRHMAQALGIPAHWLAPNEEVA